MSVATQKTPHIIWVIFPPLFTHSDIRHFALTHIKFFSCDFYWTIVCCYFCHSFCFRYLCTDIFLEFQNILYIFVFSLDSCRGRCHCTVSYFVTSPGRGFWRRLLGQWAKGVDNPAYVWPPTSTEFMGNQPPLAGITVAWNTT